MTIRISIDDPKLFPVQAFFNAVSDNSFLQVIDCLANGLGYSINETDCSFPADLDSDDQPFDGVRFCLFEGSTEISLDELNRFMRIVCDEHIKRNLEDEQALNRLLSRSAGG